MKRIVAEKGVFGGLSRGFLATCMRYVSRGRAHGGAALTCGSDGTYTLGLLGITPLIQDWLVAEHKWNVSLAGLGSSLVAGTLCGVLSCPFDVIKTSMQGDLQGTKYSSFSKTVYAQRKRLFSGVAWRCANVVGTIMIANEFRVRVGPIMFPSKYEQLQ